MNRSESKYFGTAVRMDEALMSLLEKKDFPYITVREVCQAAQVNRSTFYLHYETMTDLLEEAVQHALRQFYEAFSPAQSAIRDAIASASLSSLNLLTDEYLTPYLRFMQEHRSLFTTMQRHATLMGMDNVYRYLFDHIFSPILARLAVDEKNHPYIITFYLHGLIAIVQQWLSEDCKRSIEEISELMRNCVNGQITPMAMDITKNADA